MKKIWILITLVVIAVMVSLPTYWILTDRIIVRPPVLVSQEPRVNFTFGKVEKKEPGEKEWSSVIVGMSIPEGTVVRTGDDSNTDIRFADEIVIKVAENSQLLIRQSDIMARVIDLKQGSMYGVFKRDHKDQQIRIHTPTAVASVRGTQLGFETFEKEIDTPVEEVDIAEGEEKTARDSESKKTTDEKDEAFPSEKQLVDATRIYAITGIVEIRNEELPEENLLLSFQNQADVARGYPPENPVKISTDDSQRLRNIINSIHMEEVLLISDEIYFDRGSSVIKDESADEMNRIANILKSRSEIVRIEGHTDDTGNATINQKLSLERAESIRKQLIAKGIDKKRLEIRGYGSSNPVVPNDSEKNRAKNRRVEFIIID